MSMILLRMYGLIWGGGIIRHDKGELIAVFSVFYGAGTNNIAEFLALKDGLDLCTTMAFQDIMVECDLQIFVNAIQKAKIPH